jgi:hypothetical protein
MCGSLIYTGSNIMFNIKRESNENHPTTIAQLIVKGSSSMSFAQFGLLGVKKSAGLDVDTPGPSNHQKQHKNINV